MKHVSFFVYSATILVLSLSSAQAKNVVVENFVSQKCGIVPDSEKNLKSIVEKQGDVLVLTCHLDEDLGVTQKVASECNDRKWSYLGNFKYSDPGSPTIMINGSYKTRGMYHKIVSSGVNMARAEHSLPNIDVRIIDGVLTADLPTMKFDAPVDLWIFAYDHKKSSVVSFPGGGSQDDHDHAHDADGNHIQSMPIESSTTTVDVEFINVVKVVKKLDSWSGRAENIQIPINSFQADGFSIVAQEYNLGSIVALGTIDTALEN